MKQFLQRIFSVRTEDKKHKCICLLGIKIKIRNKKKQKEPFSNQKIDALLKIVQDLDYKQNLIMDYYLESSKALPATGALAKRQAENLLLLKEFNRICEKYELEYWIDFGTLLGAVRHNGFVPWDDDIDVSMIHSNLLKFNDAFLQEKSEDFDFLLWDSRQSRLIFKNDTGAFLDIYAYEDLGDRIRYIPEMVSITDKRGIPKDIIYPLNKITFGDGLFWAPKEIETYLQARYGNWKTLPKHMHYIPGHSPLEEYKNFYPEEDELIEKGLI